MTPKTTAPSDVAIITVSYNSSAQLKEFLPGAIASVAHANQVFVADNNSDDLAATRDLCAGLGVSLVSLDVNQGYGGAINRVVQTLPEQFSILLISNPDVRLEPDAVARICETTLSESTYGSVGPKILNLDGSIYPSARAIPSISNGIGHALFANLWPRNPWTASYHTQSRSSNDAVETGWVSGACLGIRRETFESLHGFDDKYFMYFEDVDLGYRLKKTGYRNIYLPSAVVTHIGGESTKNVKAKMLTIHHESALRFIKLRYPGILWAPLRLAVKAGLALRLKIQISQATSQN